MSKKTLATLTDEELAVINEYQEVFGYSSQGEALEAALSEGSITEDEGKAEWLPEGFKRLKLFTGHQRANETKLNKALRKAKLPELFIEDNFYLGTTLTKDDNKDFILDECSTTDCGERPEIVIIRVGYKAVRAAFNAQGQPEASNFDSTISDSIYPQGQRAMLTPYGDVKTVVDNLKKEYHDGKQGKTQAKVPANLKVKFKAVVFGLVKTEDGVWEKFMFEASNRYSEEENLFTEWNKRDNTVRIISKFKSILTITGTDSFENSIVQIIEPTVMSDKEFKEVAPLIPDSTRAVAKFITSQVDALKGANAEVSNSVASNEDIDESEDEVPEF